jgi:cytoskeletal protein CcmA (bactofilin family)
LKLANEAKTTSFLSESIELKGNLYVQGSIRIDGKVAGKIEGESTIYIGEMAVVKAEIIADSIISNGAVKGDIQAQDLVKVSLPGVLEGEVRTSQFSIEQGVYFNGRCQILSPKNNPKEKLLTAAKIKKAIAHRE